MLPSAVVEIPRILPEERWQQRIAEHGRREGRSVERGIALGVALGSRAEPAEIIPRLLNTRNHGGADEPGRIADRLPGQLELLPSGQRNRVSAIADPEIGQDAKKTLPRLLPDLLFRELDFRDRDVDVDVAEGQRQSHWWEGRHVSRCEDARHSLARETRCCHGEAEWPGGNARVREAAIRARINLDAGRRIVAPQRDLGSGDGRTGLVHDAAVDGSGRLKIERRRGLRPGTRAERQGTGSSARS